jgi:hypothetical protein
MDFNDFVSQYNQYDALDDDLDRIEKSAILTFEYDQRHDNVSAMYKTVPVFRNKKYENVILAGEIWLCTLDTTHPNYYFATPIHKIDASFLFELKKSQIDEIAEIIWKNHEGVIRPQLDEKYHDIMNEAISKAVDNTKIKYQAELEERDSKIIILEQRDNENKQIIASLEEKAKTKPISAVFENGPAGTGLAPFQNLIQNISVRRTGPDTLQSDFFSQSRYFIHVSADHRIMVIRPHPQGNVLCIDNTLSLAGLSLVSSFAEPYDVISEYSPEYEGLQIYLK